MTSADIEGLSVVMAARGGDADEHREQACRLVGQLPVLSVVQMNLELVGWCSAIRD